MTKIGTNTFALLGDFGPRVASRKAPLYLKQKPEHQKTIPRVLLLGVCQPPPHRWKSETQNRRRRSASRPASPPWRRRSIRSAVRRWERSRRGFLGRVVGWRARNGFNPSWVLKIGNWVLNWVRTEQGAINETWLSFRCPDMSVTMTSLGR